MSHINIKVPSMGTLKMKEKAITDFTGGVNFCMFPTDLRVGQSPYMKNLVSNKNLLRTRFGQKDVENAENISGSYHSRCEELFFDHEVLHIGSCLVTFDGQQSRVILDTFPDCDSFMFEMNSKVYIFCKVERIFILDKDFSVTEYELPGITPIIDADAELKTYTETEVVDNCLVGMVTIKYRSQYGFKEAFILPCECDTDYPITIYDTEAKEYIVDGEFTVLEDKKTIKLAEIRRTALNITYMPARGSKYKTSTNIFDCTHAICYGGYKNGGTRVFFSGNPNQQSYYFYSELLDPLTIKLFSYDILGDGSQDIVKFAKQKGNLIAFCDRSVHKITYNFDDETGFSFTNAEISSKIGCDMPGSVQLIDNRLVFANTSSGVHIITSSDYTDELSVRSISANILGSGLDTGFLSLAKKDGSKCFSIDFDRKYLLFFGTHGFVWDYSQYGYTTSLEPIEAERRLSWYYFDGIRENAIFEIAGKLYGVYESEGDTRFMFFSDEDFTDFGEDIVCEFMTPEIELSTVQAKKLLKEVFFSVLKENAEIKVFVYADGKEIQSESFDVKACTDEKIGKLERLYIAAKPYEGYRFSFKISSTSGVLGIYDILLRFNSDRIFYR